MRRGRTARTGLVMRSEGEASQKAESLRADILALLREKRYEEALAALYRARSETPDDPHLQKSIHQIKEFLIGAYAKRLGGLDRIAEPIPPSALQSPDKVLLARYIDGTSTYDDVAQMCPLGKLRTLQVLLGIYSGQEPPRIEDAAESARRDDAAEARKRDADAPTSGVRVPDAGLAPELGTTRMKPRTPRAALPSPRWRERSKPRKRAATTSCSRRARPPTSSVATPTRWRRSRPALACA